MKKKHLILKLLIIVAAFLLVNMGFGTLAYFTDSKYTAATMKAGTVDIKIHENFNPPIKEIKIENVGTKRSYVRVKAVPVWQEEVNGKWVDTSLNPDNVIITVDNISNGKWVLSNGFYYYKGILNSGELTEPQLKLTVSYNQDTISQYKGKRLKLRVYGEAVQASNDMYKQIWNLNSLPWN